MKAIVTRYRGATQHRPSRIIASDLDGSRATVTYDSSKGDYDAHLLATRALCQKMNWHGVLFSGAIKGGMVWVWYQDARGIHQGNRWEV